MLQQKRIALERPVLRYGEQVLICKAGLAYWKAERGYKIHIARCIVSFQHQRGRLIVTYYCGNAGAHSRPFRPDCDGSVGKCRDCFRKYGRKLKNARP